MTVLLAAGADVHSQGIVSSSSSIYVVFSEIMINILFLHYHYHYCYIVLVPNVLIILLIAIVISVV